VELHARHQIGAFWAHEDLQHVDVVGPTTRSSWLNLLDASAERREHVAEQKLDQILPVGC
jgi:hypothetical protein